jgi:ParB/RepB/Spo0J family partition protein
MGTSLTSGEIGNVPFGMLEPHPDNIRVELTDIEELAASIEGSGLHTPLKVRATEDGTGFTILAGHRRHAALQLLKTPTDTPIPALITTSNGQSDPVTMLVENIHRVDIDELEQADGIAQLVEYGLTQAQISASTGLSKSVVAERVRLSKLPSRYHPLVRAGIMRLSEAIEVANGLHKVPEEVINATDETINFDGPTWNDARTLLDVVRAAARIETINKGVKLSDAAGFETFRSEKDVDVPSGKTLGWSDAIDDVSKLPKKTKKVIVTQGPDGAPRYRPVVFKESTESFADAAKEETKKHTQLNREWKVEQLENWQAVLGKGPRKADAVQNVIDFVFDRDVLYEPQPVWRLACQILDIVPEKDSETTVEDAWWEAYEKSPTKPIVAFLASKMLSQSTHEHTPPRWEGFKSFWL